MSHRTRGTHRTFWQRKPPTDRHRCAQIRRVWHPAIPTPPITQPNHLWKSVNSVGEYYHAHKQANGERVPTEYAEHTEHSGRESLPQIGTDAHRLGGYGIPAIPTLPITQPNIPWKSVKSVGEYYHAGAAASAAPTKQTEREFSQNTQNTQNLLAEKCLPQIDTDVHRLGGYGIPAIPTPPITQPNHLWKSVGEYYHAGTAASAAPTKQTERVSHRTRRTHRTFWQRKPPTDRHRCAQIRRVWHPCHTHATNNAA